MKMRYPVGEVPVHIEPLIGHGPIMIAVVIGLLTGIGMLLGGMRTGILWLLLWGGSSILASLTYIGYYLLF